MEIFYLIMTVLSFICMGYLGLCTIRILLSWFHSPEMEGIKVFFNRLTDPYLNLFRGLTWARIGMFDFTVIIGIGILYFCQWFFAKLGSGSYVSIGSILAFIIVWVWGVFAFLLLITAIVLIVRMIFVLLRKESAIWYSLDGMITNLTSRVMGFFTHKPVSFSVALGVTAAILITLRFSIGYLVMLLSNYLEAIL